MRGQEDSPSGRGRPRPQHRIRHSAGLLWRAGRLCPRNILRMQSLAALPAFGQAPVPARTRHPEIEGRFLAGDSLESKLLCLQVSVLSSDLCFVGAGHPNPGGPEGMKGPRRLSTFGQDLTEPPMWFPLTLHPSLFLLSPLLPLFLPWLR